MKGVWVCRSTSLVAASSPARPASPASPPWPAPRRYGPRRRHGHRRGHEVRDADRAGRRQHRRSRLHQAGPVVLHRSRAPHRGRLRQPPRRPTSSSSAPATPAAPPPPPASTTACPSSCSRSSARVQGRGGGIGMCNTNFTKSYGEKIGQDLTVDVDDRPAPLGPHLREPRQGVARLDVVQPLRRGRRLAHRQVRRVRRRARLLPRLRAQRHHPRDLLLPPVAHRRRLDDLPRGDRLLPADRRALRRLAERREARRRPRHLPVLHLRPAAREGRDGRVDGVVATTDDGSHVYYRGTKGIVLATGGIDMDDEMVDYYCDPIVHGCLENQNGPAGYSTGDGHQDGHLGRCHDAARPVPAACCTRRPAACSTAPSCSSTGGRALLQRGHLGPGQVDERHAPDRPHRLVHHGRQLRRAERQDARERRGRRHVLGLHGRRGGRPLQARGRHRHRRGVARGRGRHLLQGRLPRGARRAHRRRPGHDAVPSVDRYNELVEAGDSDDDFHKQADFLFPVVEPPFYAARSAWRCSPSWAACSINNTLQVLDTNRQPIEGLYATGNAPATCTPSTTRSTWRATPTAAA